MIIKFHGSQTMTQFIENMGTVVKDITERAGLSVKENDIKLKDVQIGVTFNVDGQERFLEVCHDGITELFTVNVKLTEAGEIDLTKDNEEETFLDDYTRAIAKGEEKEYTAIESVYNQEELQLVDSVDGGDIVENIYKHEKTGDTVVQFYKNSELVGEFAYNPDEKGSQA